MTLVVPDQTRPDRCTLAVVVVEVVAMVGRDAGSGVKPRLSLEYANSIVLDAPYIPFIMRRAFIHKHNSLRGN